MKKANKTKFIVLLCFALLFIAGTVMLLFIPEPKPLKITEKITVTESGGEYFLQGKIKNVTKNRIIINPTDLYIKLSAVGENGNKIKTEARLNDSISLDPNEEFDVSVIRIRLNSVKSVKVTKVIYTPEKVGITLYGNVVNNGKFAIFSLLTGVTGVAFLIIAIVSYRVDVNNTRRVNNIIMQIRQTLGDGIHVTGRYGNKANDRSATAKTTASVFGAIVSALFIGFGRYKVYSTNAQSEFIITETAIYMYINGKFTDFTNELKSAFVNPAVYEKGKKLLVKGDDKNVYLSLRVNNNDKKEVSNSLQNIFKI